MSLYNTYEFDELRRVWHTHDMQNFPYSDGDAVENYIFESLKNANDLSVHSEELRPLQKDWPSQYHLTSLRSNLLRPLKDTLLKGASVLELGCGCGAVTRFLGESAKKVVAVEGSYRRASIAAERCRDLENVTVIVDAIQSIPDEIERFDIITLIGVLEYSRVYGTGVCQELEILTKAKSLLKPNGVLIIAIENKLGLKYLAGDPEDHVGIPWFGVKDLYTKNSVATFTRKELLALFAKAGFANSDQYIPVPDYKLPKAILHPQSLDVDETIFSKAQFLKTIATPKRDKAVYDFASAWTPVCEGGLAHELANSLCFTVYAGASPTHVWEKNVIATNYGVFFDKTSAKEAKFRLQENGVFVERAYLYPNLQDTSEKGYQHYLENEPYLQGTILFEDVLRAMQRPAWTVEGLCDVLNPWYQWLNTQTIEDTGCLPTRMIDATPFNVMLQDGQITYFDKEWAYEGILPVESMIFRSLFYTFTRIVLVNAPKQAFQRNYFQLICAILQRFGYPVDKEFMEKTIEHAFAFNARLNIQSLNMEQVKEYTLRLDLLAEHRELVETCNRLRKK